MAAGSYGPASVSTGLRSPLPPPRFKTWVRSLWCSLPCALPLPNGFHSTTLELKPGQFWGEKGDDLNNKRGYKRTIEAPGRGAGISEFG